MSLDDGINPGGVESPGIHADNAGFFMNCPNCGVRVPMERLEARGKEAFRVAR